MVEACCFGLVEAVRGLTGIRTRNERVCVGSLCRLECKCVAVVVAVGRCCCYERGRVDVEGRCVEMFRSGRR